MARLSREESRARTREQLLASAARAFARAGYGGASVDEIAEDAGFSKGAFYSNFASKEAIFLALLEQKKRGEIAAIRSLLAEPDTDALMRGLRAWLDAAHDDPALSLLAAEIELQARRSESLAAGYRALQERLSTELVGFIAAVFGRLGLRPPAPVADIAATFIAISNGAAMATDPGANQSGRLMQLFLDMVLKASRPADAGDSDG
ncbi:TetR/AcrR family transcriptional regulator [Kaistia geumhonensis]|uniref:AcrR family transcriptional regulator n=1 Tax=Kaistia geumhonensis TaxID=410839 RepID=A0ABU0M4Y8_9HYPH|nr:TetR/AcrR family transcriptional regulator [Kaistia geumhonensis]MCX5478758.1 TetR/AcrR family transcriptional regulator [Kaistia geumhonensis]MDQ0516023.1 AcrR family transcriptional regulator [Kaistia geumhonensis]